jgi:membrane fusion protein (multidrug efflux system)
VGPWVEADGANLWIVETGLAAGDRVIVDGMARLLAPGSPIVLGPPPGAPGTPAAAGAPPAAPAQTGANDDAKPAAPAKP